MEMKGNKHFLITTISILLIITGLTSCGNLLLKDIEVEDTPTLSAVHKKTGSISGSIAFDGAIPSALIQTESSDGSRTATPSVNFNDTSKYTFEVLAQSSNGNINGSLTGNDFRIDGLETNVEYTIRVLLTDTSDNIILSGNYGTTITLTDDEPGINLTEPVIIKPGKKARNGSVKLPIQSASSLIDKAEVYIWGMDTPLKTIDFHYNGESSTEYLELSAEDITSFSESASFVITLAFYANSSNGDILLYSAKEAINTFDNMVTNYWCKTGNEEYITDFGIFYLTQEQLQIFQRNTYYVDFSASNSTQRGNQLNPFTSLESALNLVKDLPDAKTIYVRGFDIGDPYTLENGYTLKQDLTIIPYKDKPGDYSSTKQTFDVIQKCNKPVLTVISGAELNLTGMNITRDASVTNSASTGGFILGLEATINLTDCSFTNGKATNAGGAIYTQGDLLLENCIFSGNTANGISDAIHCKEEATLTLKGKTYFNNDAITIHGKGNKITVDGELDLGNNEYCANLHILYYYPEQLSNLEAQNVNLETAKSYFNFTTADHNNHFIDDEGYFQRNYFVNSSSTATDTPDGSFELPYKTVDDLISHADIEHTTTTIYIQGYNKLYGLNSAMSFGQNAKVTIESYSETIGNIKGIVLSRTGDFSVSDITVSEGAQLTIRGVDFKNTEKVCLENGCYINISSDSTVNLESCSFDMGYVTVGKKGGAIYNEGTLSLKNCTFKSSNLQNLNISDNTWEENSIYCASGTIILEGSTTFDNTIMCLEKAGNYTSTIKIDENWSPSGKVKLELVGFSSGDTLLTGNLLENIASKFFFSEKNSTVGLSASGKLTDTKVLYVSSTGHDDVGYGYSADAPFATLVHAFAQCNNTITKTIWVEASTETEYISSQQQLYGMKADVIVTNDLSSKTPGGKKPIKLTNGAQLLLSTSSTISLTGFDFTRDGKVGDGGFMGTAGNSTLSLTNCSFSDATVTTNGGALINGSTCTMNLTGCTFSNNIAGSTKNDIFVSDNSTFNLYSGNTFDGGLLLIKTANINVLENLTDQIPINIRSSDNYGSYSSTNRIVIPAENVTLTGSEFNLDESDKVIRNDGTLLKVITIQSTSASTYKDIEAISVPSRIYFTESGSLTLSSTAFKVPLEFIGSDDPDKKTTITVKNVVLGESTSGSSFTNIDFIINDDKGTLTSGGAFTFTDSGTYNFTNCAFESTSTIVSGDGAFFYIDSNATVNANNCSFSNAQASGKGGVAYILGRLNLSGTTTCSNCKQNGVDNFFYCCGSNATEGTVLLSIDGYFDFSEQTQQSQTIAVEKKAQVEFGNDFDFDISNAIYWSIDDISIYDSMNYLGCIPVYINKAQKFQANHKDKKLSSAMHYFKGSYITGFYQQYDNSNGYT